MKVLFTSGDIGGVRALLPVVSKCFEKSCPFLVLRHGYIANEIRPEWESGALEDEKNEQSIEDFLKKNTIGVLVFASSVHDTLPLRIARQAKSLEIPVVHILDNWTGYELRMKNDDKPMFQPNYYTVIDDIAYHEAIKSGVANTNLVITGQPALASLWDDYLEWKNRNLAHEIKKLGFDPEKLLITFISEPVEDDQGASDACASYRGYTEKTVLRMFCEALQNKTKEFQVAILPHPRENIKGLNEFWQTVRGYLEGGILKIEKGRDSLFLSDGIAGMASILLYEAWLLGKPVISLQPEIRLEALKMLQKREGVIFIDSSLALENKVNIWTRNIIRKKFCEPKQEIKIHKNAANEIYKLIMNCMNMSRTKRKENLVSL